MIRFGSISTTAVKRTGRCAPDQARTCRAAYPKMRSRPCVSRHRSSYARRYRRSVADVHTAASCFVAVALSRASPVMHLDFASLKRQTGCDGSQKRTRHSAMFGAEPQEKWTAQGTAEFEVEAAKDLHEKLIRAGWGHGRVYRHRAGGHAVSVRALAACLLGKGREVSRHPRDG